MRALSRHLPKIGLVFASLAAVVVLAGSMAPASASAQVPPPSGGGGKPPAACPSGSFFGLEPWYAYLNVQKDPTTGHCEVSFPKGDGLLGKNSGILLIVLAVVDDLLRVAGIVAVIFVIVGGFKFITAQGEPDAAASARKTLMFAIIGLVVALIAVIIVSFIGNAIGA